MNRFKVKQWIKRIIATIIVFAMIVPLCALNPDTYSKVNADTVDFETSISGFPESYKPYLRMLHQKYPAWKFVPHNTGINFATAVSNQIGNKSLLENSYSKYLKSNAVGDYNPVTGTYITKDGGSWVSASKNCIAYFMDPRNFLTEKHIFMFEQLSYDATSQTQAGVEAILDGSFMHNTAINYINKNGKFKTTTTLYSAKIMEAAEKSGVSAYYIASKILQEIGRSKNPTYAGMGASGSVTGTYSAEYTGIYNFYNIGASSGDNPIANGLAWASSGDTYERPWNTPSKSIIGGAKYIGEKYINCGQNTVYFQRFNVNKNSIYSLYTHQYMTNIYGAVNEASYTYEAYESLGIISQEKTFVIPVYDNMPADNNVVKIGTTNNKTGVISSTVNVRKKASTESDIKISLATGTPVVVLEGVVTEVEFGTKWLSNPYWYKIQYTNKKGNAKTGYVAATYVKLDSEYNVITGNSITLPITLASSETVYYMSDNPAVATVDDSGNVTGIAPGTATITVFTVAGMMRSTAVTVYNEGVTFDVSSIELDIGKKYKLTTTVYPIGSEATVTYTSSDKSIAKVSAKGKITAKSVGTAVIKATSSTGGLEATCIVKVIKPVETVAMKKTTAKVQVGASKVLTVNVLPIDATYKNMTWSSSDESIVVVDSTGKITGVAAGTATITAKSHNGKKTTCQITVKPAQMVLQAKSSDYNTIKLYWAATKNITGYKIYKKNSKGKYKVIATVSGNATSYKDTNLITGKKYAYKIKAYRKVGDTTYNSKLSTKVKVASAPKKPKITSIKGKGNNVTLKWNVVSGATGYIVYRSESKTGTYTKVATVSKTKYKDKQLATGKIYYYKVIAYTKVSKKNIYSMESKKVSIKK